VYYQFKLFERINRDQLCEAFKKNGCHIIDGNSNFILVKLPFGVDIIVINIKESYPELTSDWLRISINTKSNNRPIG